MLHIFTDKDKVLRTKCSEFPKPYTKEDKDLLIEMVNYLKLSQDDEYAKQHNIQSGIGLACPQIGVSKRGFAIYLTDNNKTYQYALLNPVILKTSVKRAYLNGGEGCLSVKKKHPGLTMRYYKVVLQGYDALTEKEVTITAFGYLAICIQHEYDHLDGILYYDRFDKNDPFKIENGAVSI